MVLMSAEEILRVVQQHDWLLGREVFIQGAGYADIVAIDPDKNEVTLQITRHRRTKLSLQEVQDYFVLCYLAHAWQPDQNH